MIADPAKDTGAPLLPPSNVDSVYADDLPAAAGDVAVKWPLSGKAPPGDS